ncbi:hypothetical protein VTI74DRAFT_10725 [Chaetomium olivicolor]
MSENPQIVYGSDAMVRQLSDLNIPYIALIPGSSFRGLHDSIVNFNGNHNPEIILCLHEEHSVAIAHGFAKITEHPMAAIVHDAVGLMHAIMAVYNAHCDRMAVLLLGGNGPLDATRRRMWVDWIHTAGDEGALIRHYVNFDDQPASVQAAISSIITATAAASQIPRGPTFVCLDVALQEDKISNPAAIHFPSTERYSQAAKNPPGPSPEDVASIRKALLQAKRQRRLFLFGRVNRSQKSWDERIKLAERYDARVLTDLKVAASFPTRHRLHAAAPDLFLNNEEIEGIRAADVIVSFDWVDLAGTLKMAFAENDRLGEAPEQITIVNITLDFPAIHNGWTKDHFAQPPVDIAVTADVDKTVSAILAATPEQHHPVSTTWWPTPSPKNPLPTSKSYSPTDKITITALTHALYTAIPPSEISLIRLPLGFKGADLLTTHPLSFLGQDGGAGTGSGPGNAVGAALALKHLQSKLLPVAVLGDGDFLMGSSALWSAVRHRVPLLVVVANNRSFYNDEKHQVDVARQRGRPVGNAGVGTRIDDPAPDLAGIGAALGAATIAGGQVRKREELGGVLERAVREVRGGKVVVVDVLVVPEEEG